MGELIFKYGTMNCSKTLQIITTAYDMEEVKLRPLVIKPKIDTKGADQLVSRIGLKRKVDYVIETNEDLYQLVTKHMEEHPIDILMIDEAQFLTEEQVNQLFELATLAKFNINCYGIRTDFMHQVFPGSARLLAIAHRLEKLSTLCSEGCGNEASSVLRYVDDEVVLAGEQVVIDDQKKVKYTAVCHPCRKRLIDKS